MVDGGELKRLQPRACTWIASIHSV